MEEESIEVVERGTEDESEETFPGDNVTRVEEVEVSGVGVESGEDAEEGTEEDPEEAGVETPEEVIDGKAEDETEEEVERVDLVPVRVGNVSVVVLVAIDVLLDEAMVKDETQFTVEMTVDVRVYVSVLVKG